ncbi:tetratricopeptide repeat protein [Candidatus Bipolaricaulota bacterium]
MPIAQLATYLAMDRRQGLVDGFSLPDRMTGSALLADISGFTPLTEALVDHLGARRGAEELTKLLNTVYTGLVSRVHHFGGSIVCFIGDALIACFPDDSGLRALACGLQMQRVMKQFQALPAPHGGRVNLAMKAAVAVGPMRRFLVGSPEIRLIDVLAGKTIDRLSDAEHTANPGDVVASPEVIRRLGNRLVVDEWRGRIGVIAGLRENVATPSWPKLTAEGVAPAALQPYLLSPVYQRVTAGQGDFLSELRPVAAIFLKFDGIDYDGDDAAGKKLNAYTAWVQSEVRRFGGHVLLLTTADKGSHLYAVFGALEAHEDDCQRAVAAAKALLEVPKELHYIKGTQIGVSYGRARVGAYGGETRHTYGALGDVVNLAARLMGIAPVGEIRCSETVVKRSEEHWEFEALEAVQLKGMSRPQPVYRPLGRSLEMTSSGNEFVGRQDELGVLIAALAEAKTGSRRIQLIEGDAGIGKSRLVDELIRVAEEEGFSCLFGAGDSIEQHTPYRAWRDILTVLLDLDVGTSAQQRREIVLKRIVQLDPSAADRAPLLNDILALDLRESAQTISYAPEVRQKSLAALVGDLVTQYASAHPVLLILDDAHWLDSLSWELTTSVARSLAQLPSLLVLSHRPFGELEPAGLSALAGLSNANRLALGALPLEATLMLAACQIGLPASALPDAVGELLAERAEGNPFYARELVNALLDTEQIYIEAGRCTMIGDSQALRESVPSTLEGIVLSRLDRLPTEEQLTMKVASVIGRSFLLRTLQNVYPSQVEGGELRNHLEDTTRRRLTLLESDDPEPSYSFQHIVTQQVAYDTLLFEQRRGLHRDVAGWYEQAHADNLSPHYPLLVFHWNRAGQEELECRYCQLAGQQAAGQYANTEAEMYLTRALKLLEEMGEDANSERRFELLRQRVQVFAILGRVDEERTDLDAVLAIAGMSQDVSKQGEVLVDWSDFHNRCGQYDEALDCGYTALRAMQEAETAEGEARVLTQLANTFEAQGEFENAREKVRSALSIFRDAGVTDGEAASLKSLGIISTRLGELPQAMEHFEAARELYRQVGDRKGEADILGNLGALSYYLGDYETTIRYTEQAQPMFEDMGNRIGSAKCLSNLGNSYSALGAFDDALHYHERSLTVYQQLQDVNSCADAYANIGNAHHAIGVKGFPELSMRTHDANESLTQSIECHTEALQLRRQIGARGGEAVCLFSLGSVYSTIGDLDQAESSLRMSEAMSQELGLARLSMRCASALARVRLKSNDVAGALAESELVMEWLGDQILPDADEMCFTHFMVLLAAGERELAVPYLKAAHDSFAGRLSSVRDEELREKIHAVNREIIDAWKDYGRGSASENLA